MRHFCDIKSSQILVESRYCKNKEKWLKPFKIKVFSHFLNIGMTRLELATS
nr:MAG TPA: hypothetical protein [Caudoviricetes sp.]